MHVVGLEFVIIATALFLGAIVQGSLGFGMVLMAFPALVLVDPELLPQTTLLVSLPMVLYMAWLHRGRADWREVVILTSGRLPGFVLAILILGAISARSIALIAGSVVLLAVALSFRAPEVPRNTFTLAFAGTVSAVFGTTVSIGGPPIALLYQHAEGPRLRSTMSLLLLFGGPLSLVALAFSGNISATDLRTGLALMPFSLFGSYSAKWVIPWFDQRLRPIVLTVCAVGAAVAMIRLGFN